MNFHNKVVIITGGSAGIGLATAFIFAKNGASVVIVGKTEAKLNDAADKIAQVGKKPLIIQADVSKDDEARTIIIKTIEEFGKIDVLVNNAGAINFGSLLDNDVMEQYDKMTGVNIRAVVLITSLAAPYLIKSKGNIVNVSSILGTSFLGKPYGLTYGISKAGLDHFTKGVALELAPSGVRANTVSPGPTKTGLLTASGLNNTWDDVLNSYNLDKLADPEEVADMIVYLASDKAKSITGGYYVIDNGCLILRN